MLRTLSVVAALAACHAKPPRALFYVDGAVIAGSGTVILAEGGAHRDGELVTVGVLCAAVGALMIAATRHGEH